MIIRCVGGNAVRLTVHATLPIWPKASLLAVSRVVLVVVGVAVVGVVVTRVLLSVCLRLRACTSGRLLRLLLLGLRGRVGGAVATVLAVASTAKSRLVMGRSALGVLAEVVRLRSVVATEGSLLGCSSAVVLAMNSRLLSKLLAVEVVVRVSFLLVCGVVARVVVGRRAEGSTGLLSLRLRSRCREVVEWRLRNRRALLVEGIQWLGRGRGGSSCSRVLRAGLAKATVLLLGIRDGRLRSWEAVS